MKSNTAGDDSLANPLKGNSGSFFQSLVIMEMW